MIKKKTGRIFVVGGIIFLIDVIFGLRDAIVGFEVFLVSLPLSKLL